MKNKRLWKKLLAAGVCTALMLSTSVTSFAAGNIENVEDAVKENELLKEVNEEEIVSEETDVMPSIDPMIVEYEPGKKFEIPVNMGSGKYKAVAVSFGENSHYLLRYYMSDSHSHFLDGMGHLCYLNHDTNVLPVTLESDYAYVKPGVYDIVINLVLESSEGDTRIIKNRNVKINVSDKYGFTGTKPEKVGSIIKTDYIDDVTFYLKNGTEAYNIESVDFLTFGESGNGYVPSFQSGFQYDKESGAITISADLLRRAYAVGANSYDGDGDGFLEMLVNAEFTFENGLKGSTFANSDMEADWYLSYATPDAADESIPIFIDSYQEFDGTQDLTFQFKNGTGDNKITAIKEVVFSMKDGFVAGDNGLYLDWFRTKDGDTGFQYDLEKCEVTLLKDSLSDFIYNNWNAISNTYGNCYMIVEFADGRTGGVYARDRGDFRNPFRPKWKSDWEVKVLEKKQNGWTETESGWVYYENGEKVIGWKLIHETWYYFNENGIMKTGWVSVDGHWYYMNNNGAMETGWVSVDGHWYYMNNSGAMETGWVSVDGHWYYMNNSGAMETGWVSVDGHWYYMNNSGAMETGWVSVDGYWYYMNNSGAMETGWVSVDGYWYYFHNDGSMATSQWIGDYYVQADGAMATNTWIGNYYVDTSGKWVKNA